jgi:hypothetical protein
MAKHTRTVSVTINFRRGPNADMLDAIARVFTRNIVKAMIQTEVEAAELGITILGWDREISSPVEN